MKMKMVKMMMKMMRRGLTDTNEAARRQSSANKTVNQLQLFRKTTQQSADAAADMRRKSRIKEPADQLMMLDKAVRRSNNMCSTFDHLAKQGLTRTELRALIAKRPTLWARFSGWLETLPETHADKER